MNFLKTKKFKDWSFSVCAIITILGVILKIFSNFQSIDILLYSVLGWFFLIDSFERVDKK